MQSPDLDPQLGDDALGKGPETEVLAFNETCDDNYPVADLLGECPISSWDGMRNVRQDILAVKLIHQG